MQIGHGDDSTCQHQIFYLPTDKRPPPTSTRLSLSEVLEKRQQRQYVFGRKKWIARVARLVAESVLRFDWRDARRGPHTRNLIFYESSSQAFEPFLEVQIDSHGQIPAVIEQDTLAARKTVLLNLGLILLELSSPYPLSVYPSNWSILQYQSYLNTGSRNIGVAKSTGMGDRYAQVIRNCADFEVPTLKVDRSVIDEEQFQKTYFANIVSPLKRVEESLPAETEMGQHGQK
jgi:hypothetical protein